MMKHDYPDIRALTTRGPAWYDQDGVPRYRRFHTGLCPDPYARWIVLLQIGCQRCCHPFLVEVHGGVWNPEPGPVAHLNYGDPPPHEDRLGQKCWGDTMSSDNLAVVEVWIQSEETLEFERHPDQEGPIVLQGDGREELDHQKQEEGSNVTAQDPKEKVDYFHGGPVMCTATTKAGKPCRNYAVFGTRPPRCAPHGGRMGQWVGKRAEEKRDDVSTVEPGA